MPSYTDIPDSDIDPQSILDESLFTRLRDNPLAVAEGATGAPRIMLPALFTPIAAGATKKRQDASTSSSGATSFNTRYEWTFLNTGSVRAGIEYRTDPAGVGTAEARIVRTRAGVDTVIASDTGSGTYKIFEADVDIEIFDEVKIQVRNTSAAPSDGTQYRDLYFATSGGDIFPFTIGSGFVNWAF